MGVNNTNLIEELLSAKKSLCETSGAILQAHTRFTQQYDQFLSLAEQIENRY
jgi:hypothetical protein